MRSIYTMLTQWLAVSTLCLFTFLSAASAHEVRPAIADVKLSQDSVEMVIRLSVEPIMAGIDLAQIEDTNDAPQAEANDALRALSADEMQSRFVEAWPALQEGFIVRAGDAPVTLSLDGIQVTPLEDIELPRESVLMLSGQLPDNGADVAIGWRSEFGPLILRQIGGGDDAYTEILTNGTLSAPLPREGTATESGLSAFLRYIGVGFDHIIPKGLDHILFVLGLFFLSLKFRPLILQITVFTVAHTITLALASLGIVTIPAAIVEPLIAASIVYVAIENIFGGEIRWWRPVVIFGFGLLHGLGFASVLGEFGLAPGQFVAALIGFNIGVEIGQLVVIGLAMLLVTLAVQAARIKPLADEEDPVRDIAVMYRAIATAGSILIALNGAFWVIERVFF